jgi:hypothetical protein
VQRRYPLLYYCRSSKALVTPKVLAAAQQRQERQQEQVRVQWSRGTAPNAL